MHIYRSAPAGLTAVLACIAVWTGSGLAWAVPACPEAASVRQPDGSVVTLYLRGDEFAHWHEDERGYAVARSGQTGAWVYAIEVDGRILPTQHVVGQADPQAIGLVKPNTDRIAAQAADGRAARAAALALTAQDSSKLSGQRTSAVNVRQNLVVLVNFADLTITSTNQEFDDLFNQVGYGVDGAVGSVKDYYQEVSCGAELIESTIVGPVTLDKGYAYYGGDSGGPGSDNNVAHMVIEALVQLEDPNYGFDFDFSTVDGNDDGLIDGLTIIHAGGGQEYSGNDANYIWSHAGIFGYLVYDGVLMAGYHTEPARRGWDSNPSSWGITRIGVICHEMGHYLALLPDLYDYGGDSRGVGGFCIMAYGSWNGDAGTSPAHFSAWCKAYLMLTTPTVIASPGTYTLAQAETSLQVYKLQGALPSNEYFLIENRQGMGFDAALPGSSRGMLIWHIDESRPNNDNQTHYKVDVEEASGIQHLQLNMNDGQDSDYYREGNVTEFDETTTPNSTGYTGIPIGLGIANVGPTGPNMVFDVTVPYTLTLDAINGLFGQVELDPEPDDANAPVYPSGTTVTLLAEANPDREFSHWDVYDPNHPGDANHIASDTNNPTTILMSADREVTAVFKCGSGSPGYFVAIVAMIASMAFLRRKR